MFRISLIIIFINLCICQLLRRLIVSQIRKKRNMYIKKLMIAIFNFKASPKKKYILNLSGINSIRK